MYAKSKFFPMKKDKKSRYKKNLFRRDYYYRQSCNIKIEWKVICMPKGMKIFQIHLIIITKGNKREA
jgi:hypothetical protein